MKRNSLFGLLIILPIFSLQATGLLKWASKIRESLRLRKSSSYRVMAQVSPALLRGISDSPDLASHAIDKWLSEHGGVLTYPSNNRRPLNRTLLASIIYKIIKNESKAPNYYNFFHGTDSELYIFLVLQKKLYSRYYGQTPHEMEFLRPLGTRQELRKIHAKKYDASKRDIYNPKRIQVISVGYLPWEHAPIYMGESTSGVDMFLKYWLKKALEGYGLRPSNDHLNYPQITHKDLFIHIQLKKWAMKRYAYDSEDFGFKSGKKLPGKNLTYTRWTRDNGLPLRNMARIILDPQIFDHPNRSLKIHVYENLTDEEKKEIDNFCERLLDKSGAFFWNRQDTLQMVFEEMQFGSN